MEIRKVSEKIVLDEGRKSRIITEGRKIALQRRKRMKMRCGVASVLLIMWIVVLQLVDYPKQGNVYPITVYAQEISEACEIDMIEESEFSLEKQETPLGLGYVLYATIEDGHQYKTQPSATQYPGWMLSLEQIYEAVWKENVVGCEHVVYNVICQLRRKLKNPDLIQTMVGRGYRFVEEKVSPGTEQRENYSG